MSKAILYILPEGLKKIVANGRYEKHITSIELWHKETSKMRYFVKGQYTLPAAATSCILKNSRLDFGIRLI